MIINNLKIKWKKIMVNKIRKISAYFTDTTEFFPILQNLWKVIMKIVNSII